MNKEEAIIKIESLKVREQILIDTIKFMKKENNFLEKQIEYLQRDKAYLMKENKRLIISNEGLGKK